MKHPAVGVPSVVISTMSLVAATLLLSRVRYVPIWDGRIYAECFIAAATPPFSMDELRCATHASQAYTAYMTVLQIVAPQSYVPMLVANAMLYVVAAIALYRLLHLVFPAPELRLDRAFVLAAFLVQPSILAAVVQPGLDLPLLPGVLWCLVFLIERRWVALCVVGTLMAFSKETGVLLYAAIMGSYGLWMLLTEAGSFLARVRTTVVQLIPLTVPGVLFGLYLVWRKVTSPAGQAVLYSASTTGESLIRQALVPRLDLYLINYLVILLLLNFAWIASAWIGVDAFVGAVRTLHRLPRRVISGGDTRLVTLLTIVTVATMYALTRFATFGNSRYVIPVMAVLLFPFLASMLRLGLPRNARLAVLALFGIALAVSCMRTVDPISRGLYGTFAFGDRRMLRMTRITHECCGAGRDQLVYSLEFTKLADLTSDALAAAAVTDSTLVLIPDLTTWDAVGRVDSTTRKRTLRADHSFELKELEYDSLLKAPVPFQRAVLVGLPYGDVAEAVTGLRSAYDVAEVRTSRRGAYAMDAYEVRPKPMAQ